jgi:hypothetical protein
METIATIATNQSESDELSAIAGQKLPRDNWKGPGRA